MKNHKKIEGFEKHEQELIRSLIYLADNDPEARQLFEVLKDRKKDKGTTDLYKFLGTHAPLSYKTHQHLFDRLEQLGVGVRRQDPSARWKFIWWFKPSYVGKVALKEAPSLFETENGKNHHKVLMETHEPPSQVRISDPDAAILHRPLEDSTNFTHNVLLDVRGRVASLSLPVNLTKEELEKIITFLKTIPTNL